MIKTRVITGLADMRIRDVERFLDNVLTHAHDQKLVIHLAREKKQSTMQGIARAMVDIKKKHVTGNGGEYASLSESEAKRLFGQLSTARSAIGTGMRFDALYGAVSSVNEDFQALTKLLDHVSFHRVAGNLLLPQQSVVKNLLSLYDEQDELLKGMIRRLKRKGRTNMHALFDEYDALHNLLREEQQLVRHGEFFIKELSMYASDNLKNDLTMLRTSGKDLLRDIKTLDVPRFQQSLKLRFKRVVAFWMDTYLAQFLTLYTLVMGASLYDCAISEKRFHDDFERLRGQVEKNLQLVAHFRD